MKTNGGNALIQKGYFDMGKWDLSILYSGFDDPKYSSDIEELSARSKSLSDLAAKVGELDKKELMISYVKESEAISTLISKLAIFANLRYSANTKDTDAASALGKVMNIAAGTARADTVIKAAIAGEAKLPEMIKSVPELSDYEYFLMNIARDGKYLLSDGEEELFAKMNMSGASAWSDLQSSLTSSLKVKLGDETVNLSTVRNLAYDPDPEVRRSAYEAELAAYEKIKEPVAFALNSIKLQVLSECALRGFSSPLDKALYNSRMKRETLDALMGAIDEYLPVFRKYLRAKAKALGHEGGLPWYDLFAPMGKADKKYTVSDAKDYLLGVFGKFDAELHNMVKEAFECGWIDFYPRDGKVGGAFDCGVPSAKESRVLTNFDGSFSDVITLAHELGHSFHDRQVFRHSIINQDYSMPVAETASTFNEVMVMADAIAGAETKEEKLLLIESELMDATQIIVDIYSRYLFEGSVFEKREEEFMDADKLSGLMLEAQKKAYGDGLDEKTMHPFMWVCKGHYYSGGLSFYNFPYAFGGLFARGLYAKYKKEGKDFVSTYKKLLYTTPIADVEDAAAIAGVDLTSRDFWRAGLSMMADEIEEFCDLVK